MQRREAGDHGSDDSARKLLTIVGLMAKDTIRLSFQSAVFMMSKFLSPMSAFQWMQSSLKTSKRVNPRIVAFSC
jgi:hypothetical protein